MHRAAERAIASTSHMCPAYTAALVEDWTSSGERLHRLCRCKALTVGAECGQESWCQDGSSSRHTRPEVTVRMGRKKLLDPLLHLDTMLVEGLQLRHQGLHQLNLRPGSPGQSRQLRLVEFGKEAFACGLVPRVAVLAQEPPDFRH